MPEVVLEKVGPANLTRCGIGCLTNPKNPGFGSKVEWLQARFAEGLGLLLIRSPQLKTRPDMKPPADYFRLVRDAPGRENPWKDLAAERLRILGAASRPAVEK